MRVFVTGGSGHLGSAVIPDLLSAGHTVVGLARSEGSAAKLERYGATVVRGDLDDLDTLARAATEAEGVIHLAFKHELMRSGQFPAAVDADLRAITTLGEALVGTNKPLVTTSGTLLLAAAAGIAGRAGTEDDFAAGGPRVDAENYTIALSEHDVRSSVVRLPPITHSDLDHHGFAHVLIEIARSNGYAGYIGEGANRWPSVYTLDAARLYRLALEKAPAGSRLHAAGDQGVSFRQIAGTIARKLDVPAKPVAAEDIEAYFTFLAPFAALDNLVSTAKTRHLLGWEPTGPGLIEDLEHGHYFKDAARN